jgi:hypothetical protein
MNGEIIVVTGLVLAFLIVVCAMSGVRFSIALGSFKCELSLEKLF